MILNSLALAGLELTMIIRLPLTLQLPPAYAFKVRDYRYVPPHCHANLLFQSFIV